MNDKEHRNLERAGKADTDRILTIPNVLSFFRLALIPVIIVLYAKNEVWWAFGMLVLSGVTDVVDGWVARTYHMVSNFGKAIDPGCRQADADRRAAVPHAYEVLVGRRHSGFERGLHRAS